MAKWGGGISKRVSNGPKASFEFHVDVGDASDAFVDDEGITREENPVIARIPIAVPSELVNASSLVVVFPLSPPLVVFKGSACPWTQGDT